MSVERPSASPIRAWQRIALRCRLLKSHGLFIAEGRLVVRRLIEEGRHRLRSLLVNEAAAQSLGPLLATIGSVPIPLRDGRLPWLTGHDIHRGCLALVERPPALACRRFSIRYRPAPSPTAGTGVAADRTDRRFARPRWSSFSKV
jgi:tRNA G18 (ribose-2'-O)-methylase SpoU